ncbi:MAG: amino acid ABC transporter substrate-binding protein [Synechocystis sp.]|nr:amino acid ABC transporter substrate-binding protein [Synechocystis sp.]
MKHLWHFPGNSFLLSLLLCLNSLLGPPAVNAQPTQPIAPGSILRSIQKTGLFTIAIREDAVPFGFRDGPANQWTGICVDLAEILRQRISAELGGQILMVKIYQSSLFNRFSLIDEGIASLECGPNTIRDDLPYQVTFSEPFLITGTQLLIRAEDLNQFEGNVDLTAKRIGVLRGTSNLDFLKKNYPRADLLEFQGSTARQRGVQSLVQKKIDAFASDGILLFGEALLLNLAFSRDYLLYPSIPLDCQQYGLILPQGDRQWQALVNEVVNSPESQAIYQKWVGLIFPAIQQVQTYCETQPTTSPSSDFAPPSSPSR